MSRMREIGQRLQAEQGLTEEDITWLTVMAQAILRAFIWDSGEPMRQLAATLGISPDTLYRTLRLVVEAMMWVRRSKQAVTQLVEQVEKQKERLIELEHALVAAQAEVIHLSQAVSAAQGRVAILQSQVAELQSQWQVMKDRLIVVLKLSGRCTVRSIVEVLEYGLGIQVSVGYVQGIIAQAGHNAGPKLTQLLAVIPLSGAICIDEVFLKELGCRVLGVVIVDPMTGLVLRLQRCSERSKEAIGTVLQDFNRAGFRDQIKLVLTDMYSGYLEPVSKYLPKAAHQFCWFHINCFHIGATVHRAKRAYNKAVKALAAFDRKHTGALSEAKQRERQDLVAVRDQAHQYWLGAQRFQQRLLRILWTPSLCQAMKHLDQLLRVAPQVNNPYVRSMSQFLLQHETGLLAFHVCLHTGKHLLQRLSRSQQTWVPVTQRWALPTTSNAAEHVFRYLRRFTHGMDHFGTEQATERFFDLFVFYYNLRTLRSGKRQGATLLSAAHINVVHLFGTDDLYTILGFPPPTQTFTLCQSVRSATASTT